MADIYTDHSSGILDNDASVYERFCYSAVSIELPQCMRHVHMQVCLLKQSSCLGMSP